MIWIWTLLAIVVGWLFWRLKVRKGIVIVLVLGDLGHSPRMSNHATSLLTHGYTVHLVGYAGSAPLQSLVNHVRMTIHTLYKPSRLLESKARLLRGIIRLLSQWTSLLLILFKTGVPEIILVQNPPSIPTLLIGQLLRVLGSKLVIDWHNFGYSILSLDSTVHPRIVGALKWVEQSLARADIHLTVTKTMAHVLSNDWHVKDTIATLYDHPPQQWFSLKSSSQLFQELDFAGEELIYASHASHPEIPDWKETALVVTSTSWTPDEDFSILIKGLSEYETMSTSNPLLPKLLVVITGKGPLQSSYMAQIRGLNLKRVTVKTAWLRIEDYPKLLASATLGLSFHISSSGIDLPMKVVDMFGCGLPALSVRYQCIDELVIDGVNGYLFDDGLSLATLLKKYLQGYPSKNDELRSLKVSLEKWRTAWGHWDSEWDRVLLPLLDP